jgi:uncharacterized protein DUF1566
MTLFMKWQVTLVLLSFPIVATIAGAQSSTEDRGLAQETQVRGYWVDPSTGLMWAGKDNGKDISYYKGMKYCRNLRLAGYSGWRLATMFELQPLYDRSVEAPGRAGDGKGGNPRDFTWHVKGNLFLTGDQWSSGRILDDRGKPSGYGYYFDFNEGKSNDDQLGYSAGKRALCVRRSGE